MDRNGFAAMVDRAMKQKGINSPRLSILIGVLEDGRVVDRTTLDRIRRGQRRTQDPAIVARLIEVLELEPKAAWRAAYPEVATALEGSALGPDAGQGGPGQPGASMRWRTRQAA